MAGTAMVSFGVGIVGTAAVLAGHGHVSIVGAANGMTPQQARELAAVLAEAADRADPPGAPDA
jgi:hypothetical protein